MGSVSVSSCSESVSVRVRMHVCVRVYVSGQVSTSASLRTSQMAFFFGRQTIILIATLAGRNNNKNKTKKKIKRKEVGFSLVLWEQGRFFSAVCKWKGVPSVRRWACEMGSWSIWKHIIIERLEVHYILYIKSDGAYLTAANDDWWWWICFIFFCIVMS